MKLKTIFQIFFNKFLLFLLKYLRDRRLNESKQRQQ